MKLKILIITVVLIFILKASYSQNDSLLKNTVEEVWVQKPYFVGSIGIDYSYGNKVNQLIALHPQCQYHYQRQIFSINPYFDIKDASFSGVGLGYSVKFYKRNKNILSNAYFGGNIKILFNQFNFHQYQIVDNSFILSDKIYHSKSSSIELLLLVGNNFNLSKRWILNAEFGLGTLFSSSINTPIDCIDCMDKSFKGGDNGTSSYFKIGLGYRFGKICAR